MAGGPTPQLASGCASIAPTSRRMVPGCTHTSSSRKRTNLVSACASAAPCFWLWIF